MTLTKILGCLGSQIMSVTSVRQNGWWVMTPNIDGIDCGDWRALIKVGVKTNLLSPPNEKRPQSDLRAVVHQQTAQLLP